MITTHIHTNKELVLFDLVFVRDENAACSVSIAISQVLRHSMQPLLQVFA